MFKVFKPLFALLAIAALLGACKPPTPDVAIERIEERITNKLDLTTEQQQKLTRLTEVMKPAVTKTTEALGQSHEKWHKIIDSSIDKNKDIDPTLMVSLIDNVIDVYQANKNEVTIAMADFYNSLDQDQKRKVAKIVRRGSGKHGKHGEHGEHGKHGEHGEHGKHGEHEHGKHGHTDEHMTKDESS